MCNEEGGGGWRSAAGSCRRRCAVPLLPGSARLGSSRLGSAPGCPEGAGTDPSRLGEGCGAVPIPFQPQEGLGLSHSFSSSGRIWGCPDPHPNPGVAGAAPTPHTHLLTAPLSCAGPCAPTFGGGGGREGVAARGAASDGHEGLWEMPSFLLGKVQLASGSVTSSRLRSPPYEALPPAANLSPCRLAFFLSNFMLFFFFLPLSLTFLFLFFFSPKGFFPIGIPSP